MFKNFNDHFTCRLLGNAPVETHTTGSKTSGVFASCQSENGCVQMHVTYNSNENSEWLKIVHMPVVEYGHIDDTQGTVIYEGPLSPCVKS